LLWIEKLERPRPRLKLHEKREKRKSPSRSTISADESNPGKKRRSLLHHRGERALILKEVECVCLSPTGKLGPLRRKKGEGKRRTPRLLLSIPWERTDSYPRLPVREEINPFQPSLFTAGKGGGKNLVFIITPALRLKSTAEGRRCRQRKRGGGEPFFEAF